MRYAIPVSGGKVSPHFGHCEFFAVMDTDENNRQIVRKELMPSPGHQPGLLPGWLAEQGVAVVIAGGMGSRAQGLFREHRIGVVVGAVESDPERAVLSYLDGQLTTEGNICDH